MVKLEAARLDYKLMTVRVFLMLWSCQDEILATEKVLVEGLWFDLQVELPYSHLFKFVELLRGIWALYVVCYVCVSSALNQQIGWEECLWNDERLWNDYSV